mgnify:CR=1 FL=1
MRILFAEDDRDISKAVQTLLERSGYSVDVVFNGQDALDYIEAGDYDGVILDWMMPGYSGMQFIKDYRDQGYKTPVLFLTGKGDLSQYQVEALRAGADDYVSKPYEPMILVEKLRAMIRRIEYSNKSHGAEGNRHEYCGGELIIDIEQNNGRIEHLYLTGPTNIVCKGEVTDEDLCLTK